MPRIDCFKHIKGNKELEKHFSSIGEDLPESEQRDKAIELANKYYKIIHDDMNVLNTLLKKPRVVFKPKNNLEQIKKVKEEADAKIKALRNQAEGSQKNSGAGDKGVPFIKKIFDKIRSITKLNKVQHNILFNIDTKLSKEIADAYEKMKHDPNNPKVKKAYKAMVEETKQQYDALIEGGLKAERWTGKGEPYANSKEMLSDLKENNHLWFLPNESAFGDKDAATKYKDNIGLQDSGITLDGKPLTNSEVFRIVHDAVHGINGNEFGAIGEENATLQHLSMYSDEALPAVVAQTRGQNSWVNFSGVNDSANAKFKEAAKLEKEGKYDEAKKIRKEAQKEFIFAEPKIGLLPNKYNFRYYGTKNSEIASKEGTNTRSGDGNKGESQPINALTDEKNLARESKSFSSRSNNRGRTIRTSYGDVVPKAIHTVKQSLIDGINKVFPNAAIDKELFEVDADIFHKAAIKAKSVNKYGAAVDILSPKEYSNYRLFITEDGLTGIALSPTGDLGSGFDMSGKSRRLVQLLVLGIENGATHANAFDTILPDYYSAFGFKPVARNLWNDALKPKDWNYTTFEKWNKGRPDVVHFVWDGGDRNNIHERIGQFDNYSDYHKEQTPVINTWEEAQEIVQQSIPTQEVKADVESYEGMFNPKKTGISGLDDLLKDDGYNYFYKGVSGEIVMMSPDEYLKKVRDDITRSSSDLNIYDEKKASIIEGVNKGDKINMPYLSIKENGKAHKQEGRNRAVVARERGEKLIPVFIEKDISFDDKIKKGNEYVKSAVESGANTKEEVLSKLKEQGLHRDAVRFISENFNNELLPTQENKTKNNKNETGNEIQSPTEIGQINDVLESAGNKAESDNEVELNEAIQEAEQVILATGIKTATIPIGDLIVAPKVFQYKASINESGTNANEQIKDSFDPNDAGTIGVWLDVNNELGNGANKVYVVDGHHRTERARLDNVESMNVFFINAPTAKDAMVIAARTNIKQGKGTSIDAAKVIRENPDAMKGLIAPNSKVAKEGQALAKLNDKLFEEVSTGNLSMKSAIALSNVSLENQDKVRNTVAKYANNPTANQDRLNRYAVLAERQLEKGNADVVSQVNLFGEEFEVDTQAMAEVQSEIVSNLKDDARLLSSASRNADILENANSKIDTEATANEGQKSKLASALFDKQINEKGTREIFDKAVSDYKNAKSKSEKDAIIKRATQKIKDEIVKQEVKLSSKQESKESKEYESAKRAYDNKRKELYGSAMSDNADLFGNVRSQENSLFGDQTEKASEENIQKALAPFKVRLDNAKKALEKANKDSQSQGTLFSAKKENDTSSKSLATTLKKLIATLKKSIKATVFSDQELLKNKLKEYGVDYTKFMQGVNRLNVDLLDFSDVSKKISKNKIEGKLFNEQQSIELQKEIESKYSDTPKFGLDIGNEDIRTKMFNYDNPIAEKDVNGVNLRIAEGFIEEDKNGRRKTYLLYADGKIVGKFYSVNDAKSVVKLIESNLVNRPSISFMRTPKGVIYGAKFPDGSIYINDEDIDLSSPIHEFSHLFEEMFPELWAEGLRLFRDSSGFKKALAEVQKNPSYKNLSEPKQASEALNNLIGNKGVGYFAKGVLLSKFQNWVKKLFKTIGAKISSKLGDKLAKRFALTPDDKLEFFVNDVLGKLLGGKELKGETKISNITKFSQEYENSPQFEKWKGKNRLVSDRAVQDVKTGEPIVAKVYHGTTNEFYEFDASVKGNIEGHLGKVNYFTTSEEDANENYLASGSDITSRISRESERLEDYLYDEYGIVARQSPPVKITDEDYQKISEEFNISVKELKEQKTSQLYKFIAERQLKGNEEKVLDLYVKLNNPIVLGNGATWFDALEIDETYLEEATQEVADEYGVSEQEAKDEYDYEIRDRAIEKQGEGNKVVEALEKALSDNGYDSSLASQILGDNYYETEVDLDNIEKSLRKAELYENDNGEMASSQVIADLFKNLGFDGIILTDVSERFKNMGLNNSTSHIHVFDEFSNQIKLADGTNTTFNPDTNDIRYMSINGKQVQVKALGADVVNGFYSPLEKIISEVKQDKMPVKQWVEKFAKGDEAKFTGLTDWLNTQQGSVSKTDIQNYLKDNRIEIVEVVKGEALDKKQLDPRKNSEGNWDIYYKGEKIFVLDDYQAKDREEAIEVVLDADIDWKGGTTKFSQYQLEGEKENYKEVLVLLPTSIETAYPRQLENGNWVIQYRDGGTSFEYKSKAFVEKAIKEGIKAKGEIKKVGEFRSTHFEEPNILVHLRMNTRTDADGNKVLFLEEVQSDWGQKGKKEGGFAEKFKPSEVKAVTEKENSAANQPNLFWYFEVPDNVLQIPKSRYATEAEARNYVLSEKTNRTGGVPSAPFVTDTNAWTKLGLKVALKEAVKQGEQMQRAAFEKLVDEKMDWVEARMKKLGKLEVKCP